MPTSQPLAARMRPRDLSEFVGQQHVIGEGRVLRKAIDSGMPFPKTRRIVFENNKPASLPGWALLEIA